MTLIVQKSNLSEKIKVKQWRIGEAESGEEEAALKNTNYFKINLSDIKLYYYIFQ